MSDDESGPPDNGYETPDDGHGTPEDDQPAPLSLTPRDSPTKYKENDTDILTQFITDASGFVDQIERSTLALRDSSNPSDSLRNQISKARHDLHELKRHAVRNEQFRSYVENKFPQVKTPQILDQWLCTLINTLALESRQLLHEAQQAGAQVAEGIRRRQHKSREQQARRVLGGEVERDDAETTKCGDGPCVVQLRL